jgi:formate hydrogenlyase subunit 6/NADH:ubiquinone oxidoreductase subunit I
LSSTFFDAAVTNLEASYYASAAPSLIMPQVSNRFQRMLKWSREDPVSRWGRPRCVHKKVGCIGCHECPEIGFVPFLMDESIANKQDLLENVKAKYFRFEFCDPY